MSESAAKAEEQRQGQAQENMFQIGGDDDSDEAEEDKEVAREEGKDDGHNQNDNDNQMPKEESAFNENEEEQEGETQLIKTDGTNKKKTVLHEDLDLLDDVRMQQANDAAIAKLACEQFIEEEDWDETTAQSNNIELAFEESTQDSSGGKSTEPQPSLTKRFPLKNREKAEMCYHRLPAIGRKQVLEQHDCYFKVEISIPFKQLQQEEGNNSNQDTA